MGKKGSWFSAIKRVFTPHSKEKLNNQEQERKNGKEKKKKGFGKSQTNSFLPIFREPSSIEKILGDAERDHNLVFRPPSPLPSPLPLPRPTSPRVVSPRRDLPRSLSSELADRSKSPPPPLRPVSPRVPSPRPTSPRVASPQANSIKPPSPRGDLPRLDLPKPPSPKAEPSRLDVPRLPSPRAEPSRLEFPKLPSPRSEPPRLEAPRSTTPKPRSPRTEPPRLDAPRLPSPISDPPRFTTPKPPSPRAEPPRLDASRSTAFKPPSTRAEPPRLDTTRCTTLKPPSPRAEPPRSDTISSTTPKPPSPRAELPTLEAPRPPSPRAEPPRLEAPRPPSPKPPSPRAVLPVQRREVVNRPEPTLLVQHASATKIQTVYRGYTARRSFRALKGLVRLQGVVRGYSVKRQTINAMKYMQQVVRVQSQIQSRRLKTLERQAHLEKDEAKTENDDWDDSVLTKEERDARSQRKIDAIVKRERSMAYAYSHKLWKNSPKSAQGIRSSGGLWWNWVDRQLPLASPAPSLSQPLRDYRQTPTRLSPSPLSQSSNLHRDNNVDASTPKSSRSTLLTPSRAFRTSTSRYSRGRYQDSPFKDDDSLTSCPPFPSYMAPTASAKAKVRPNSNPKERVTSTNTTPRRMSYPPMQQQGLDTFRWNNKGSLLMSKGGSGSGSGSGSPGGVVLEKHKTLRSVGNLSIDSTVSMPASVGGRKPFNRFV